MGWGGRDYPEWVNGDIRIAWNCGDQEYTVYRDGKAVKRGNSWDSVKCWIGGGSQSMYKQVTA